jgi:TrmH family RNA methyltransferase
VRRIVSPDNPLYRELLAVAGSARERRRRDATLIEGVHLCEAYLQRFGAPRVAAVGESALESSEVRDLLAAFERGGCVPVILSDALFKGLSAVEHGVAIACLIATPRAEMPARLDADLVYLDRVQDPGNVGTILRTCAAVGVRRVVTAPESAVCWSPKVLRSAMGAHFALDLHESVAWAEVRKRLAPGVSVRAAGAGALTCLYDCELSGPSVWMFGREGSGLDPALIDATVQGVSIPQSPAVESLNVGVAAAVCLYEQLRQRRR